MAVEDNIIAFSYDPLEVHTFAWIVPSHTLEVLNEGLLAIRHMRIVLDVGGACVLFDRVRRFALVEHQIVERKHVSLVTLHGFTVHLDLQAAARPTLSMTRNGMPLSPGSGALSATEPNGGPPAWNSTDVVPSAFWYVH
jgi:hypothetical protein